MTLSTSFLRLALVAAALPVQLASAAGGYSIVTAQHSGKSYPYLTEESVSRRLRPDIALRLPSSAARRLVVLNVKFKSNVAGQMTKLDPTDLEVQWAAGQAKGSAPVLGVHMSKDFIVMGSGEGFFTSMRPDSYELFAIVPKSARQISLSQRQDDGSFKVVKSNIRLAAAE